MSEREDEEEENRRLFGRCISRGVLCCVAVFRFVSHPRVAVLVICSLGVKWNAAKEKGREKRACRVVLGSVRCALKQKKTTTHVVCGVK